MYKTQIGFKCVRAHICSVELKLLNSYCFRAFKSKYCITLAEGGISSLFNYTEFLYGELIECWFEINV